MILLLISAALAAQVRMLADTQELVVGQQVRLQISVDGQDRPPQPELAAVPGVELQLLGPPSYTSSVSFGSGGSLQSSTWTWSYALSALEAGDYSLGPAQVGGDRSGALELHVQPAAQAGALELLEAEVGTERAYLGQTLVWRAKLQTELRAKGHSWSLPALEGFERDPLAKDTTSDLYSVIDGRNVSSMRAAVALVAVEPGEVAVPSAVLKLQLPMGGRFGFLESRQKLFTSKPQTLQVLPLPAGQVPEQWSGLVGHFTAIAQVDRRELALGESLSLRLLIEGDGSVAGLRLAPLELAGAQVFADAPGLRGELDGARYRGRAVLAFEILPEQAGPLHIPAFELQVFDPSSGQYVLLQTQPQEVLVVQGAATEPQRQDFAPAPSAQAQAPVILSPRASPSQRSQLFSPWHPLALGLVGAPGLGFVGLLVARALSGRAPKTDPHAALRARVRSFTDLGGGEAVLRECLALTLNKAPERLREQELLLALPILWPKLQQMRYGAGGGGDTPALLEALRAACLSLLETP